MSRAALRGVDLGLVAAGGAVGAVLRWLLGDQVPDGSGFPWTIFQINVAGAFLLGALPLLPAVRRSRRVAVALGPGLLGGFTTVSTWAGEARDLAAGGSEALAVLYVLGTLVAALAAARLGRLLSHRPEPEDALR